MHIKLKDYLIDLLDNHDVTEWTDMPDEYRAKCWEILKDERPNEFIELMLEIMSYGDHLLHVSEGFNPHREDVDNSKIGNALSDDISSWMHWKVKECIDEINLEREERAIDNSHEDVERTPEHDNVWDILKDAIVNGVKG